MKKKKACGRIEEFLDPDTRTNYQYETIYAYHTAECYNVRKCCVLSWTDTLFRVCLTCAADRFYRFDLFLDRGSVFPVITVLFILCQQ